MKDDLTPVPQALEKLVEGYHTFKSQYFDESDDLFRELREGQTPAVLVIACSDSRVDPAIVTNCKPGDLFVVRNVANLVPPFEADNGYHGTSAALEFGVCTLGVQHIIVFGHSQCGGITSLFQNNTVFSDSLPFIKKWMELAKPAQDLANARYAAAPLEEKIMHCTELALINSLQNLKSFPWIQERVDAKKLFLHAWYFDLLTGNINTFDETQDVFRPLA